jgi:hypothetical protein
MTARALPAVSARRERLGRERTDALLRRQERLEAEVREQLEPLLGPAGRPVGDTAMAIWRRRCADAYLALPPLARARRTWIAWGRVRRALAVLALAPLWTVVCLPLRMLGLAGLGASHAGVAVIAAAAPVAAFVPLRARGRFAVPLPEPGPPWRGSRAARAAGRALAAAALAGLAVLGVLAALGPGPAGPPAGRVTPAARHADVVMVQAVVARACGAGVAVDVAPLGLHRYAARVAGGGATTVAIDRGTGFAATGARARVAGGAVACPAP